MDEQIRLDHVDEIIKKYQGEEGALIPVLQQAQDLYGYLPEEVLRYISKKTKIPYSRIYGVVTFYAQFYLTRRGRHTIRACRGTACHVKGAKPVLKTLQQYLGIKEDETTEDFKFTLETVACLGTCFLAPVVMIDRNYYGKLVPQKIQGIVKQFE